VDALSTLDANGFPRCNSARNGPRLSYEQSRYADGSKPLGKTLLLAKRSCAAQRSAKAGGHCRHGASRAIRKLAAEVFGTFALVFADTGANFQHLS
jgi:hypothetical protein